MGYSSRPAESVPGSGTGALTMTARVAGFVASAWLARAGLHPCFGVPALTIERRDAAEARADAVEEVLMDRVLGLGEAIVRELRCSRRFHEPHAPQVGEVSGHGGLRKPQDVDEIADTELPGGETAQDVNARRIGEALEDGVEIGNRRWAERAGHSRSPSQSYSPRCI